MAGFMGGSFVVILIGFSCFSWTIGYAAIKYEMPNPYHDRPVSVGDIVGTYQAMMYSMFTVMNI